MFRCIVITCHTTSPDGHCEPPRPSAPFGAAATAALLLLFFSVAGPLGAQVPGTEEVRLNEFRGTAAGTPPVPLPFGAGKLVVLWEDFREARVPYQHAVFAQTLLYPSTIGGNRLLTPAGGFAASPDAVPAGAEGFLLVWQEYSPTVTSSSILCATVDTGCSAPGSPVLLSADSAGFPSHPRIARAAAAGIAGATWQQSGGKNMILLRTFDGALRMLCDPRGQNTAQSLSALFPAIAMQPEGSIQIAWVDKSDLKRTVVIQRNTPAGVKLGGNREISAFGADLQISSPELALLPDSRSICVWADARDSSWSVYAQFIDTDGLPEGGNLRVSGSLPVTIMPELAVAVTERGEILIVWESPRTGTITLAAQWLDAAGALLGANFRPVSDGAFDSREPALRCRDGNAWLAWLDNRATDSPALFDVYVKRILPPSATAIPRDRIPAPAAPGIDAYPNPFSSDVSVGLREAPRAPSVRSARLYDRLGRMILDCTARLQENGLRLHSSDFPGSGVYLLRIMDGKKMMTARLVHLH